jgi:Zn finger protein HypA/HybF involved in hydrogenase expression
MTSRDERCVFVANTVAEATATANWLEHEGISARVMDALTHGGLEGLTAWTGASLRGVEVWVVNPEDAETARKLIAENEQLLAASTEAGDEKPVLAFCEECGSACEFPAELRGTIQDCPHCGRYMDAVDDEDGRRSASPDDATSPSLLSAIARIQKPIIVVVLAGMGFYFLMGIIAGIASALGF